MILDLLGCTSAVTLRELYSWATSSQVRLYRERMRELEAESARLFAKWDELPTLMTMMRERCTEQIRLVEVEAELSRYRSGESDLAGQVKGVLAQLQETARRLTRARRELAGDDLRRKAQALWGLIERIECLFAREPIERRNPRLVSRLSSVRIVPLVGACADLQPGGRTPGRARP